MRDEDNPFICYKQGWNMKIVPRNAAGWKALRLWMLATLLPVLFIIPIAIHFVDTPQEPIIIWATLPVILIVGVISIAMIRWMKVRSEIIDVDGLVEIMREQDRTRKGRR